MINKIFVPTLAMLVLLPGVVAAQLTSGSGTGNKLANFIETTVGFINSILIPAILALAFLVFVWGVFLYFVRGGADDEAQSKGKQLMLYAIGGFVLILIFFGVVNLLSNSIGLDNQSIDNSNIPKIELPRSGASGAGTTNTGNNPGNLNAAGYHGN